MGDDSEWGTGICSGKHVMFETVGICHPWSVTPLQALCMVIRRACPTSSVSMNTRQKRGSSTWSRDIESSRNSTLCLPSSSSSSSSASKPALAPEFLIPPNAALPPASEKGVEATAVPNTLAFAGAPNAAKSVTTLRGGEAEVPPGEVLGADVGLVGVVREGR